jgi:transcriptional regulator with XRE-family HTH domain
MEKIFRYETDFGGLVRTERNSQGLSMKELASRVNVSEQAISQYERGVRNLKREMGSKLAEALGYTAFNLLDKYGYRYTIIEELTGWDEETWKSISQSNPVMSKAIETTTDGLIILLEQMGYMVKEDNSGEYLISFPDGHKQKAKSAELETITDKSVDYINMLFSQLRIDSKKK